MSAHEAREREMKDKLFKTERNLQESENKIKLTQKTSME